MKTERRHELQKNELADALGHELDYLRPYAKLIGGAVVAVAVVGLAIAFFYNQRATKSANAWGDFYTVVADADPKEMAALAEQHPGTSAALWAQIAAGDMKLQTGSQRMLDDRKEAELNLDQAKRHYEAALAAADEPLLRGRAKLGLAQTYEALNDPEAAIPIYEELVKLNPDDAFGLAAKNRLDHLKRLTENKWFAWFAEHKPVPPTNPLQGRGPLDLDNLSPTNDLNKTPGLEAPGIIGTELMEDDQPEEPGIEFDRPRTKKADEPGSSEPKADDAFPVKPAPESETPAKEAPAEEAPKTETPPTDAPEEEAPKTETPPADENADEEKTNDTPAGDSE